MPHQGLCARGLMRSAAHPMREGQRRGRARGFLAGKMRRCDPSPGCIGERSLPIFEAVRAGASFTCPADEPMMASMAGRYAAALFDLAKEDKQLAAGRERRQAVPGLLDGQRGFATAGAQPGVLCRGPGQRRSPPCWKAQISGLDRQLPAA